MSEDALDFLRCGEVSSSGDYDAGRSFSGRPSWMGVGEAGLYTCVGVRAIKGEHVGGR